MDWIHLGDFLPFDYKEDNFCDFLFAFLSVHLDPKEKGSSLKGKKGEQTL